MSDLQISDAQLSSMVAKQAGQLLLELRDSFGDIDAADKDRANELRKAGDAAANEFIVAALREARPDDAILSEEEKDNDLRLSHERVWIVDPLDGTYEYGQGRADFAVHIALWHASEQRLSACTVDLPAQELTRTMSDAGAAPSPLPTDRPIRIVASRSRPPATLAATVEILARLLAEAGINAHGVEIMDVGSVGAKVNEILCGRAEAYVHDTGFYEWDVAAPYGVARHYGLIPSHVDGSEVTFNHMPPYVTDLVVVHPALVDYLRAALREAAAS
jgi:3'(2'), 5'-bisphosphate nucleotidase